jgi:enamine deaminase RidA (YjgF/YER057c/UK114 family)
LSITRQGDRGFLHELVVRGDTAYLAGVTARSGESVAEQTRDVLDQIDELLAKAGTDKTKLLTANIWLTDIGTFAEMNEVWKAWVPAGEAPARATVEAKLARPHLRVEIQVTAAI